MGRLILVSGENSSGKSAFAEKLVCAFPGKRYYIATMIPATEENDERIRIHRERRKDMGFTDAEKAFDVRTIPMEPDAAVLLEDVSNLLVNYIFIEKKNYEDALSDILALTEHCGTCVAVTISRLAGTASDEATRNYIREMYALNDRLAELSDTVIVMKNGSPEVIKGEIPDVV